MAAPTPVALPHVVIAGGGVAAVEALLALHQLAGRRVRTTLVCPNAELEIPALRTMATFTRRPLPGPMIAPIVTRTEAKLCRTVVRRVLPDEHQVLLGDDRALAYDELLIAVGARPRPAFGPEVITYGLEDRAEDVRAVLADAEAGRVRSIAFVAPASVVWTLPLYELALLAARRLRARDAGGVRLTIVTAEREPLEVFGAAATALTARLLADAGITVHTSSGVDAGSSPGTVVVEPGRRELQADRIVALPELQGPRLRGVPSDDDGFIPVDDEGRVLGLADVWAAGDATTHPVKQGGIACQFADAIAEQIAVRAGALVRHEPLAPVLRGHLLVGDGLLALDATTGAGDDAPSPLWAPAHKVEGRHLSVLLGGEPGLRPHAAALKVDITLPRHVGTTPTSLDPYSPPAHGIRESP